MHQMKIASQDPQRQVDLFENLSVEPKLSAWILEIGKPQARAWCDEDCDMAAPRSRATIMRSFRRPLPSFVSSFCILPT